MEKTFGELLLKLRKEKGWTQQRLADLLNVTNKTVSKWERNEAYPETATLIELSKLFQISVDDLLNGRVQEEIKETDQNLAERLELMNQWQIVKAGLFSKIIIILGMTVFYGLYFYTKKFVLSFFLLSCFVIVSFAFVWFKQEKIKVYTGKTNSKEDWVEWAAAIMAILILIVPCINFPIRMNTLDYYEQKMNGLIYQVYTSLDGDLIAYTHLNFLNYMRWFVYLLPAALAVYYGIVYLRLKRHRKSFLIGCTAMISAVLLALGSNYIMGVLRPYQDMEMQSYQKFKEHYVTISEGFHVSINNMNDLNYEKLNLHLIGKGRYDSYIDVSGFNDSKHRVYYALNEEQKKLGERIVYLLTFAVSSGALILCLKNKKEN